MNKVTIKDLLPYISTERMRRIVKVLEKRTDYITIVMENLYDPRNVGAVIRSCDAFGVQNIHVIELDNEFFISKRVCQGAQNWVNIHKYNASEKTVEYLHNKGYQVYFADPREEYPLIEDLPLNHKTALVFGQEKRGITPTLKEIADGGFRIALYGFVESFNVSVACALSLFNLVSRCRKNPPPGFFLDEKEKKSLFHHWLIKNTLIGNILKKLNREKEFILDEPFLIN